VLSAPGVFIYDPPAKPVKPVSSFEAKLDCKFCIFDVSKN